MSITIIIALKTTLPIFTNVSMIILRDILKVKIGSSLNTLRKMSTTDWLPISGELVQKARYINADSPVNWGTYLH